MDGVELEGLCGGTMKGRLIAQPDPSFDFFKHFHAGVLLLGVPVSDWLYGAAGPCSPVAGTPAPAVRCTTVLLPLYYRSTTALCCYLLSLLRTVLQ